MSTVVASGIRDATHEDVPALVAMGVTFFGSSVYGDHYAMDAARLTGLAHLLIEAEHGIILLAETDAGIVGMLGMLLYEHPMAAEVIASELFWWVNPEARGTWGVRLLKRAETWARAHGATILQFVAPNPAVGHLLSRLHYAPLEQTYMRRITW